MDTLEKYLEESGVIKIKEEDRVTQVLRKNQFKDRHIAKLKQSGAVRVNKKKEVIVKLGG